MCDDAVCGYMHGNVEWRRKSGNQREGANEVKGSNAHGQGDV